MAGSYAPRVVTYICDVGWTVFQDAFPSSSELTPAAAEVAGRALWFAIKQAWVGTRGFPRPDGTTSSNWGETFITRSRVQYRWETGGRAAISWGSFRNAQARYANGLRMALAGMEPVL